METKKFYLTSEFWASLAAAIAALAGALPVNNKIAGVLAVAVAIGYAISRGLAKSGTAPFPIPADGFPADEGDAGEASVKP